MGDAAKGKALFVKMCAICHTVEKDGKHRIGPNLYNIVGKTCGTRADFKYSEAMKSKGVTWNDSSLNEYLEVPKQFVPGTRMAFGGVKKPEDRKDIIAYLATLK